MIAQKYRLIKKTNPSSPLQLSDFEIVTENIDLNLKPGEIIVRALYLSTDPNVRAGGLEGKPMEIGGGSSSGDTIPGSQVGRVTHSTHPSYPPSTLVYGFFGWRTVTKYKIDPKSEGSWRGIYKLPDYFNTLPISYALGAIGMPGITAHCAVEKILEIKSGGGTFVVSTATGSVGNLVLQIGKLKGCKTLVFTSTDEKVIWLKTLGAGYIFNYNKIDADAVFREFAPEGIDFYFDNLGGSFTYSVTQHMKAGGRIAVCDAISCYGDSLKTEVPFDYLTIVDKRIRLEGFSVLGEEGFSEGEWMGAMETMAGWILEGKITVEETVLSGFSQMAQAFLDRYHGKVVGVQVVKIEE